MVELDTKEKSRRPYWGCFVGASKKSYVFRALKKVLVVEWVLGIYVGADRTYVERLVREREREKKYCRRRGPHLSPLKGRQTKAK